MSDTPTLAPDSLNDPSVANVSFGLIHERESHRITNCVELLVRPLDVRCDESGAHPDESGFVLVKLTRAEVRAIYQFLEEDWANQVRWDGDPNEPNRRKGWRVPSGDPRA